MLHISDQYGFFLPDPPRLQVYQGFLLVIIIMLVLTTFMGLSTIFVIPLEDYHPQIWRLVVATVLLLVGTLTVIWIMECLDKRRTPDFDRGTESRGSNNC